MTHLNKQVLVALLDLAQGDVHASVQAVAVAVGCSRPAVASALNELALRGLVRPETVRLTLVGLMHAAGLRERTRQVAAA
jgi:Mn-dependent DtxR family transcriptional regulator